LPSALPKCGLRRTTIGDIWRPRSAGGVASGLGVPANQQAPVGDGRPSACHGWAVACIGQPPPPSAPEPVWGVMGKATLPRLRWTGVRPHQWGRGGPQASSRGCAASWAFRAESGGLADQFSRPPVDGFALRRSIALQRLYPYPVRLYW
jgi:hypothetical protein